MGKYIHVGMWISLLCIGLKYNRSAEAAIEYMTPIKV